MTSYCQEHFNEINPNRLFDMRGKVALIVGAGGLGSVSALGLAAAGAAVAVADIDTAQAQSVAQGVQDNGGKAVACEVDVTDAGSVEAMCNKVVETLGRIDSAVLTAASTHICSPEKFPEHEWDRVIGVNLKGTFLCCQNIGRRMIAAGGGTIVVFSSIGGLVGLKKTPAYCASKGGVTQLARALAVEWAHLGVRVNAIAPSWFDTSLVRKNLTPDTEMLFRERIKMVPLQRMGHPRELVGAVLFLASSASSMVTGAVLPVDGGFLAQ